MSTVAIALRGRTFRSLRRHRNYRLFFMGQLVSVAGTWMQNIGLAWVVIQLSSSPLAVGALAFCRFLPFFLLSLVAGVVVDRLDTRRLLIATQATAMLVSVVLAVVTLAGVATLPVVYALAAIGGLILVFDSPGRQTLTFQMVGPRELPNAVALNSGLFNASRVVGPALAGVTIAVAGVGFCFVVNAVSFLAVLVALKEMRVDELTPVVKNPETRVLAGIREGLAWSSRSPIATTVLVVVTIVSTVGFNFNVLVPLLASQTLHVSAWMFGVLSASFGLGALAGALATATLRRRARARSSAARSASASRCWPSHPCTPPGSRSCCCSRWGCPSPSSRRARTRSCSSPRPTTCAGGSSASTSSPSPASPRSEGSSPGGSPRSAEPSSPSPWPASRASRRSRGPRVGCRRPWSRLPRPRGESPQRGSRPRRGRAHRLRCGPGIART